MLSANPIVLTNIVSGSLVFLSYEYLGVGHYELANNTDLNTVRSPGIYFLNANTYTNAYTTAQIRGVLEVITSGVGMLQRITEEYPTPKMYIRGLWNNNWEEWAQV